MLDEKLLRRRVTESLQSRISQAKTSPWGNICLVYLFGSRVTGRGWKREKDLDLGVYFEPHKDLALEDGELISEELKKELGIKVDVVPLNFAPPLVRYEVLKNRTLLYCADEQKRVDFEVRSLLEFYELEPMRRRLASEMKRMIREGKF